MFRHSIMRLAALILAAVVIGGTAHAQQKTKLVFAPTTTSITTGHAAHSSIPLSAGFWKEEGLEVEVIGLQGSTAGIQQVASGQVHFSSVGGEDVMKARAKGVPIVAVYTYARKPIYRIVSLSDTPITKPEHLKGKTIGVPNMAVGSVAFTRAALKTAGIDPDKDVKWLAVGLGAPALNALKKKDIDVYAVWDTEVASFENTGVKFNLIVPPWNNEMLGNVVITHEDILNKNPEWVIKMVRGIAKASIYGLANPDASIRNHWKVYPQTKPQGMDEAEALKKAKHVFLSRFDLMRLEPGVKWGQNVETVWKRMADLAIQEKLIPADFNVAAAYTNRFIDDINRFDAKKIEAMAKQSKW
ncbi:MAG: ABC transporter substrate-binding protein [Rhodospirillales bacterium]|nr:ABC transporter substrate-binding protein [Rhodospirillales bacterium]